MDMRNGRDIKPKPPPRRLTRDDWVQAALRAIESGGISAVAVEPLAAALGATKGSFYWHFRDRRDLVVAALDRWAADSNEETIARVEQLPDPADRLRTAFTEGLHGRLSSAIESALLADSADPDVAAVLHKATRRRLEYTEHLFAAVGLEAAEARRRALLGLAVYVGHIQLRRAAPRALPELDDAYVDHVLRLLIPGPAPKRARRPVRKSKRKGPAKSNP